MELVDSNDVIFVNYWRAPSSPQNHQTQSKEIYIFITKMLNEVFTLLRLFH